MKLHRHIPALGAAVFMLLTGPSFAVEQLPLPKPILNADHNIVIAQFVTKAAPKDGRCGGLLKERQYASDRDRVAAIRAYRACRAEGALQLLSVRDVNGREFAEGRRQEKELGTPN